MSETKHTPLHKLTEIEMEGMAKEIAKRFMAFERARPKVEELLGTLETLGVALRGLDGTYVWYEREFKDMRAKAREVEAALKGEA